MPRVKIDYVVSFSSENAENQASNLLALEVSKKKWLCDEGELSCSVVLQLAKSVKVESITIGAHHAALLEVLVGLSEKPNDPFQVLVPNCVLLNPSESRRGDNVERVRSFSGAQLASDARDKRWDRVRVVCTQPYNKHCQYGLSFIHIFEPEEKQQTTTTLSTASTHATAPAPAAALPARMLQLDTFSSDEEEFRPGELFAQHLSQGSITSTESQIRQASSQALRNISGSATKLQKTPISKTNNKDQNGVNGECVKNRHKDSLMYTNDDDKPHTKIDHIVQRHKEQMDKKDKHVQKEKEQIRESKKEKEDKRVPNNDRNKTNYSFSKERENTKKNDRHKTPQKRDDPIGSSTSSSSKKRKRSGDRSMEILPGPICSSPSDVLSGVEFALSGYANPRRGNLRSIATALGARYKPDWVPSCTHLICAFPNTPKLKTVRASKAATLAVTGEWIEQCNKHRRKLPWQWFATETQHRVKPPDDWEKRANSQNDEDNEEMDTDDEIERVLKRQDKQKKKRVNSPTPGACADSAPRDETDDVNRSTDSDVTFVRDERIKANITIAESDSDATEEDTRDTDDHDDDEKELPNFFEGNTFVLAEELDPEYDRALLGRYICAYGGLLLSTAELLEDTEVDYRISTQKDDQSSETTSLKCVRPEWIWSCHQKRRRVSDDEFQVTS